MSASVDQALESAVSSERNATGTAAQLTAQMKDEMQRWSSVVKAANIKLE
jgi:hypothetical protein